MDKRSRRDPSSFLKQMHSTRRRGDTMPEVSEERHVNVNQQPWAKHGNRESIHGKQEALAPQESPDKKEEENKMHSYHAIPDWWSVKI